MNKVNQRFFDVASVSRQFDGGAGTADGDSSVDIANRVARLLLVFRELDERVAGLEEVPKAELRELVSSAILACGFTDPAEAHGAVINFLQGLETPDPPWPLGS